MREAGQWSTVVWHKVVLRKEYNILPKTKKYSSKHTWAA
jgi:hypothetical protein